MIDSKVTEYMTNLGYRLGKLNDDIICYHKDKEWVSLNEAKNWYEYNKDNQKYMQEILFGNYFNTD